MASSSFDWVISSGESWDLARSRVACARSAPAAEGGRRWTVTGATLSLPATRVVSVMMSYATVHIQEEKTVRVVTSSTSSSSLFWFRVSRFAKWGRHVHFEEGKKHRKTVVKAAGGAGH